MTNRIYQDTTIFGELDIAGGGTVGPNLLAAIRDAILPVGTIVTGVATSPAATIGGTWEQIEGVFILAAGSAYPAGSTGGEATHILTLSELPSAELLITSPLGQTLASEYGGETGPLGGVSPNTGNPSYEYKANLNGENQPHNNMPPYQAEYTWKRVA